MDQVKIGKFIAELRKEQNLTQKELAEKLNLSDKTVSKWECGKGLPDNSIMISLCNLMKTSSISGIFVMIISIITLLYNMDTPLTIGPTLACGCLSLLYSVAICLCLMPIMINLIRIKTTY